MRILVMSVSKKMHYIDVMDIDKSVNAPTLRLGQRTGLPDDLRILLGRYPREIWRSHKNLGDMATFWLSRHDMFREVGRALHGGNEDFSAGKSSANEFVGWFTPRLRFLLSHLATHHQIEDQHYFPIFRAADARLASGFDLLENDHHVIHEAMDKTVVSANALLKHIRSETIDISAIVNDCVRLNGTLVDLLIKHLDDEEDLIVPMILDRGEEELGVAH